MMFYLGLVIVMLMSYIGMKYKLLTISGAWTALIVGLAINAGFGLEGLVILGAFFVTSSLFSRFKQKSKKDFEDNQKRGHTRDYVQVLANGGVAAFVSIIFKLDASPIWIYSFTAAIASATSDTWASEIGSLSRKKPFHIQSFKRVQKGTSGAISLLGTLSAFFGSVLIAFIGFLLFKEIKISTAIFIACIGFLGHFIDSLLGAFLQVQYKCKVCNRPTEKQVHCNTETIMVKGIPLIQNDMVNFLSIFLSAVLAYLLLS